MSANTGRSKQSKESRWADSREDTALALRNSRRCTTPDTNNTHLPRPAYSSRQYWDLRRPHQKRTGGRLDEGALQHKNRNEKSECGKENQEKRQDSSLQEAFHIFAHCALMPPQYSGSLWLRSKTPR